MINWIVKPDLTNYSRFYIEMVNCAENVINNISNETVYILEHENVYTTGSSISNKYDILNHTDIDIVHSDRGGKTTYHGPGQRVVYPILNLKYHKAISDIKKYVQFLENWIINTLKRFNIHSYTLPNTVGIWTNYNGSCAKIAFIGIKVKKWVSYHGISININNNLNFFSNIISCGIRNLSVTSLEQLGIKITFKEFDNILKEEFDNILI